VQLNGPIDQIKMFSILYMIVKNETNVAENVQKKRNVK